MGEQHVTNSYGYSRYEMNGHGKNRHAMNAHYAAELERDWEGNLRWQGIVRPYSAEDVIRLRVSIKIADTLARRDADRLCNCLQPERIVAALGSIRGNQA